MAARPSRARPAAAWGSLLALAVGGLASSSMLLPPTTADAAMRAACQNPAQSLGVSRVVEVDTAAGPHFGQQQYKDIELLAPGEIVLTFDDGPLRPHTQPVIDALEAQCTKATFFMVGSQAIADPEMVRQIQRKGHNIGTHTWSHANLRKSTPLKARQEIELGFSAVAAAAGQPIAPFFRFPYLADTKAMLGYTQSRHLGVFSIEVDSQDWKTKNAAAVHRDVLAQLAEHGKGIILFHDIQAATAQALPGLLEALRTKGYKVVHLKPKTMATTLPEFDALALDSAARKQALASAQPLARRSLTWGSASPTVANRMPSPQSPTAIAARPATGFGTPPAAVAGPPAVAAAPLPPPAPPAFGTAAEPLPRVARDRHVEPDWRDKIFSR